MIVWTDGSGETILHSIGRSRTGAPPSESIVSAFVQRLSCRRASILGLLVAVFFAPLVIGSVRLAPPDAAGSTDRAPSFGQAVTAAFPTAEAGFATADRAGS